MRLESAGAVLPKGASPSEDASFLQGPWMGVADGVGGWRALGVYSGNFSTELMDNCKSLAAGSTTALLHPKEVIKQAAARTKTLGSATVLLGCLRDEDSTFVAANLGDSGFIVVRDGSEVVACSTPMQAGFSEPLQAGYDPDSQQPQFDDPELAESYELRVQLGDVVVMASDGLFDYLFQREIVKCLRKCLEGGDGVGEAAVRLVRKARSRMEQTTPYFITCREQNQARVDDLTVLVGRVVFDDEMSDLVQVQEPVLLDHVEFSSLSREMSSLVMRDEATARYAAAATPADPGHRHNSHFVKEAEDGVWIALAGEVCQFSEPNFKLGFMCGDFSKELADRCSKIIVAGSRRKPKSVLHKAATCKSKCRLQKSSTLLVACIQGAKLSVANMGDSRALLIRRGQIVSATEPMCRESGLDLDNPLRISNGVAGGDDTQSGDDLSKVQEYELDVEDGDLVLFGSAGVFNNLHQDTVLKILRKNASDLEQAAAALAAKARKVMIEPSPWILGIEGHTGSKCRFKADVTLVLARVHESCHEHF